MCENFACKTRRKGCELRETPVLSGRILLCSLAQLRNIRLDLTVRQRNSGHGGRTRCWEVQDIFLLGLLHPIATLNQVLYCTTPRDPKEDNRWRRPTLDSTQSMILLHDSPHPSAARITTQQLEQFIRKYQYIYVFWATEEARERKIVSIVMR